MAVIGGGPAGCAAARAAAREGAAVALVEAASVGGRAATATTIPMRVLTRAADRGVKDWPAIRDEMAERGRAWSERLAMTLDDAGVQLVSARARFAGRARSRSRAAGRSPSSAR
ncbi:MAG: NAD(P)-binding protein [Sandaracinaceae bacterium]|nr:NAD(P)-binding protein [Sandaracinaceae bacterium]